MSIFKEITLTWKGEEYTVKADQVMGLIARIEDVITLSELHAMGLRGGAPLAKIARAYSVALSYAGAKVRDEEIYKSFFDSGEQSVPLAINALLSMMLPPEHLQEETKKKPKKKATAS